MSKDYIVQIKIKNGPLRRAMARAGYSSVRKLSDASGVTPGAIYRYLGLTVAPLSVSGGWKPSILKIAGVLRALPEDLFPPQHLVDALPENTAEVEMDLDDVAAILPAIGNPEQAMMLEDASRVMAEAISSLSPRYRNVIEKRFGLDGNGERTLEEIAQELGVTRERVRQMEKSGLRHLTHPSRSAALKEARADIYH